MDNTDTESKSLETNISVGKISFGGRRQSHYMHVRVPEHYTKLDKPEQKDVARKVLQRMREEWKLPEAEFLISVTGRGKLYKQQPALNNVVKAALVCAAENTDSWIITGGTQTGGSTGSEETIGDDTETHGKATILGLVSWHSVRDSLIGEFEKGYLEVATSDTPTTNVNIEQNQHKERSLDPVHTHFILVDCNYAKREETMIAFRYRLEHDIGHKSKVEGEGEPRLTRMILIVVGEHTDISKTVRRARKSGYPIVIRGCSENDEKRNTSKKNGCSSVPHQTQDCATNGKTKHALLKKCLDYENKNNENMISLLRYAAPHCTRYDNKEELDLNYIGTLLARLMKDESFLMYSDRREKSRERGNSTERTESSRSCETKDRDARCPVQDLFLWAVLFNRRGLDVLFWALGKDQLGGALCASALLKGLSVVAAGKEIGDLSENLEKHSREWERRACEVLTECYAVDQYKTRRLLVRLLPHWSRARKMDAGIGDDCDCCVPQCSGNLCKKSTKVYSPPTLLGIAESHEMMEFVGHTACQTKLTIIWKGYLAFNTHEWLILLCTFLPIFLPLIYFYENKKERNENGRNKVSPGEIPLTKQDRKNGCPYGLLTTLHCFYIAPITKFFCYIAMNLLFLSCFSYFVLIQLNEESPTILEFIIFVWFSTMIVEEMRQMLSPDKLSIKYRFIKWIGSLWNQVDALIFLVFIISVLLRFLLPYYGGDFKWTRAFYSVTLVLSYLRCMQYFYAVKSMGPKVVMIQKMMKDMFLFLAVLSVFVVGFGVGYHANMFPGSPPSWTIIGNIIYYPYFQIYGELFLETMRGEAAEECTTNKTIWQEEPWKRCPDESRVVLHLMLGVYLIVTNILLVNLLIAMFSYTFQRVQINSQKVWRFYRLSLVHEYFDRPAVVPPFIIVNHIIRLIRYYLPHDNGVGKMFNAFRRDFDTIEGTNGNLEKATGISKDLTNFERTAVKALLAKSGKQSDEQNGAMD